MNALEYIEGHIELIDSDLEEFFINMFTDSLVPNNCDDVVNILDRAQIPTEDARWNALDYITDRILDTWSNPQGVSLTSWVKTLFCWRFGFHDKEIVSHLVANRDNINADIYFKNADEGWCIRSL